MTTIITSATSAAAIPNEQAAIAIATFTGITTERLRLRTWNEGDAFTICEIMQNSEVNRYLAPYTLDKLPTIEAISKSAVINIKERGYGYFVCEEKATGKVIGMMGLNYTQIANRYFPCYTISWILGREFWKQGYALVHCISFIDHVRPFKSPGVARS